MIDDIWSAMDVFVGLMENQDGFINAVEGNAANE
jgi:hypothetical protein